jgi:hypothetical protein
MDLEEIGASTIFGDLQGPCGIGFEPSQR